ncbi:helix-turn-helix domain-containing protein [Pseudoprimorskyibacter insulae]|uniref:HTH-type transcriptional activator Btr n=1 Tax=Pseudoprimorskyibacter insulae TaxID=1695997 RepID=A0A2R8AYI1_9RHOB|nr:helix-turn-helix domain-containing protein [Pseudoprimorskyibacter insulae]SPF80929.1 HTH-type transcriptional activator Btr [Pseudoprimorskyibacter insulae]
MSNSRAAAIPTFFLYGDEQQDVDLDALHVEPIRERSMRHDWTIHPHVHPDHTQILWFSDGGATFTIEGKTYEAAPNCFVVQPAGMVHDIRFHPGTEGRVITAAVSFVDAVAKDDPRLIEATRLPGAYPVETSAGRDAIRHAMEQLLFETNTLDPGRRMALRSHFLSVLVWLMRVSAGQAGAGPAHRGKDYDLVNRYRAVLERHFHTEKTLAFYADKLCISPQRLNAACKARAGRTASEVLYDRIIVEAKRCLLYTEMTVAEIGHAIGYDDPAYFNRFFSQRVGCPPGTFRKDAATTRRVGS